MSQSFWKETSLPCLHQAICSSRQLETLLKRQAQPHGLRQDFFSGLETAQRTSQSGVRLQLFSAQLLTESQHPAQAGPSLANPKCLLATHLDRQMVGPFDKH